MCGRGVAGLDSSDSNPKRELIPIARPTSAARDSDHGYAGELERQVGPIPGRSSKVKGHIAWATSRDEFVSLRIRAEDRGEPLVVRHTKRLAR
jgi:hypothetical protein